MSAANLLDRLRQDEFLLEMATRGNKKLWFGTTIPDALPIGDHHQVLHTIRLVQPTKPYHTVQAALSGWMSYWRHTGPKCSSATAFIAISPKGLGRAEVNISSKEPIHEWTHEGDRHQFTLSGEWLDAFVRGMEQGLQTVLSHPLADVEIQVLNGIVDGQESDLKAFELVGQSLIERLTIELYRRKMIILIRGT